MSRRNQHATPASVEIHSRAITHEFSAAIPRLWVGDNPVLTAFYNALSTVIPEGERFFIYNVQKHYSDINDAQLQEQVKRFIAQEGSHRQDHKALNRWISAQGYPVKESEQSVRSMLDFIREKFSAKQQLAATIGLEHLSALLTDQFLRQTEVRNKLAPAMQRFFIWHSIEENEHKGVPFDVYQKLYGGYWSRIIAMLLMTSIFSASVAAIQMRYLWRQGELFNIKAWLSATGYFLCKPAWFIRIIPGFIKYFSPRFHPWQYDNSELIQQWIEQQTADELQDTL